MSKTIHVKYSNKYGNLTLKPVGAFVPFNDFELFYHKHKSKNSIDIKTAEQIALITGNEGIQIAFMKDFRAYVVLYNALGNLLTLAKVENIYFKANINPTDELEKLNKQQTKVQYY